MFCTKKGKTLAVVFAILMVLIVMLCSSCTEDKERRYSVPPYDKGQKPALPGRLKAQGNKEPVLMVYIKEEDRICKMPFEDYVAGVVGGEIKKDWPEEAIKAQAIIARTFVLRFIEEKGGSRYKGADISTDIEEAQAWDAEAVNDRIRRAVADTRGKVIVYNGKFINAWFHSNAGGMTATATEGLNYKKGNPPYIKPVKSPDDFNEVPEDERNWTVSFTKAEIIKAMKEIGTSLNGFSRVSIGKRGPSGRAMTLVFDGVEVPAPDLRVALGSMRMKSTLLDEVKLDGDRVIFRGRGYGHGVGMSQWGAYYLAKEGKKAEDIINYYFEGIQIVKMWD